MADQMLVLRDLRKTFNPGTVMRKMALAGVDLTLNKGDFITVIGGMGTIEGPIIGSIIFVILRQLLYNFSGFSMLILGVIAVVMILVAPKGIMGLINNKFNFDLFGVKRKAKISDFQNIDAAAIE